MRESHWNLTCQLVCEYSKQNYTRTVFLPHTAVSNGAIKTKRKEFKGRDEGFLKKYRIQLIVMALTPRVMDRSSRKSRRPLIKGSPIDWCHFQPDASSRIGTTFKQIKIMGWREHFICIKLLWYRYCNWQWQHNDFTFFNYNYQMWAPTITFR